METFKANFVKMKDIGEFKVSVMKNRISFASGKLFTAILAGACIVLSAHHAQAQAVDGCNPKVLEAMQKKAQAQVVYDVAVTEQIMDKPDSVLAMTCFNQAAGVSAADGGNIFSGDFTTELAPVIENALTNFYDDFGDAAGSDTATVDYAATTLQNTYDCNEMEDMWTLVEDEGVQTDVPYINFFELISGTAPAGGGDDFMNDWNSPSATNVLNQLNTVMADPFFTTPTIPTTTAASSCQALVDFGIIPGPCP